MSVWCWGAGGEWVALELPLTAWCKEDESRAQSLEVSQRSGAEARTTGNIILSPPSVSPHPTPAALSHFLSDDMTNMTPSPENTEGRL